MHGAGRVKELLASTYVTKVPSILDLNISLKHSSRILLHLKTNIA